MSLKGPTGAARDGILVLDSESAVVVDSNPFLTEILGYSRGELLGRTLRGIGTWPSGPALTAR